ncbi:MAG: hypothetical protein O9972_48100 [Burkholderiales bacterium]|nr:hypothetical protein [Burkholderiales bacterium]
MSKATNLTKRQGSVCYYARLAIPKDLRSAYGGKAELVRSTKTADLTQARRIAATILAGWHDDFEAKRQRRAVTQDDLNRAAWDRYQAIVEADDAFRASAPKKRDLDAVWQHVEAEFGEESIAGFRVFEAVRDHVARNKAERAGRLSALRGALAETEIEPVLAETQAFVDEQRLDVEPGTKEFNQIGLRVLRAEIEGLNRTIERDAGDFTGYPKDPAVKPPTGQLPAPAKRATSIMNLFDQFSREKSKISADTKAMNREIVALFDSFLGGDADVTKITRASVRDWKQTLFSWPRKARDVKAFKSMTFAQIIAANAKVGKPTISEKTINKYLSGLGSFGRWLRHNGYLSDDVISGQWLELDKSKKEKQPFDMDQLRVIFASPVFRTCAGDKREHVEGSVSIRDYRFWIPLLAIFTGARLGEILQLDVGDIRQEGDTWILSVVR